MNLLRQNSDYALRIMVNLAGHDAQEYISVRVLAQEEDVSYQFACKVLQTLHRAHLVESVMGAKGGYRLSRLPDDITMLEVIKTMQNNITVNRCTSGMETCSRQPHCSVNNTLDKLQRHLDDYLTQVTIKDLFDDSQPVNHTPTRMMSHD